MELNNPFVLKPQDYKRDIDVLRHYIDQAAVYLAKMTGKSYADSFNYVKKNLGPNGRFPFKDPKITYTERNEHGDRELKEGTLSQYLHMTIKEGDIIAPTMTCYFHPKKKKSLFAVYIGEGKKRRNKAKKEMFTAEMAQGAALKAKDLAVAMEQGRIYSFKKVEQVYAKQRNNSLSGGHNSTSTTLWNKTAHSTLTSTCRATSGYGNANNEKFLAGNRHYWSPAIATNNITSIIRHTDYKQLQAVIDKYHLYLPSAADVIDVIDYSAKHYWGTNWRNTQTHSRLFEYAEKLSPIERAAFVYTGDFYHIRQYNDAVVRTMVMQLSARIDVPHPDPVAMFKRCFEDQRNLAIVICSHVTKGIDPDKLHEHPHAYAVTASTIENIVNTVNEYGDLLKTFFVTENMPASMAYFPESIRHTALMSDTDSTIFTAQEWVEWGFGKVGFSDEENNLSSTMIYMASATITHVLARMSANFGIDESMIHNIAMKNEYKFDVFVPTNEAKHYFAVISAQEGKVYDKLKEEIKGVHLKNSNVNKGIMKIAKETMIETMENIMKGELIDLKAYLKKFADIERSIAASIAAGSHDFFRFGRVNQLDSYKRKEGEDDVAFLARTPFRFYSLWQDVFAPDYGDTPAPPYTCLKLSTSVDTMGKTKDWLASLENQALADRMRDWMKRHNKTYLGMVMLPEGIIQSRGIPKELLQVVDARNMILESTAVFYKIAETFGLYMLNDKRTKLFSDYY